MKTKLVYVLTCTPEKYYIEQAYISIFSARYYNPDATIVLIVDRLTDALFVGKRADVLRYVTEKIVVDLPKDIGPVLSSRYLKTSMRNRIDGDFLFIDCDTVITQNLSEIDNWQIEMGAALDCGRPVSLFTQWDKQNLKCNAVKCGWNFDDVENYHSTGVLYVRDTSTTHNFFNKWYEYYRYTNERGLVIDQISFQKTEQVYPIVSNINPRWNCIMFTRPMFVNEAKIIHFPATDNNSFLFSKRVLQYISMNGLTEYIRGNILCPMHTYLPYNDRDFDMAVLFSTWRWLVKATKDYGTYIDADFNDLRKNIPHATLICSLLRKKMYHVAVMFWLIYSKWKGNYNSIGRLYSTADLHE